MPTFLLFGPSLTIHIRTTCKFPFSVMCLLFLYLNDEEHSNGYRLIIAYNRDEDWDRPTKPLSFWSDKSDCISGQDEKPGKEGGTWLGASKQGRIGILLNILELNDKKKIGRGHLVNGFVSSMKSAEEFIEEKISPCAGHFYSFHLILLDLRSSTTNGVYCSHYNSDVSVKTLQNGIFTCDNSVPDKSWQKSIRNRERFSDIIQKNNHKDKKDKLVQELLSLLKDRTTWINDDEQLRKQAIEANKSDAMVQFSAPFIWLPQLRYGTRTHSIILVDSEGHCDFIETTMKTPIDPDNIEWLTNSFSFLFNHDDNTSNL